MEQEKKKKLFKEILPYIIIVIVILLIKKFIFTTILVNGTSMNNTLKEKDVMILDKVSYRFKEIKRFDIVVANVSKTRLIKRVIGLPGEHIKYENNELYINNKKVSDTYGSDVTYDFDLSEFELAKIPEDCYFIMGDNRTDSIDSRVIGVVNKKDIVGHATFIIFPFNRFENIK